MERHFEWVKTWRDPDCPASSREVASLLIMTGSKTPDRYFAVREGRAMARYQRSALYGQVPATCRIFSFDPVSIRASGHSSGNAVLHGWSARWGVPQLSSEILKTFGHTARTVHAISVPVVFLGVYPPASMPLGEGRS